DGGRRAIAGGGAHRDPAAHGEAARAGDASAHLERQAAPRGGAPAAPLRRAAPAAQADPVPPGARGGAVGGGARQAAAVAMIWDVAICGGGPAGLAAALHAAAAGFSTLVLERSAGAPDKACGEG